MLKIVVVFDDRLRNQLTDRFSTVKVEDVFSTYVSIYGREVVFTTRLMLLYQLSL